MTTAAPRMPRLAPLSQEVLLVLIALAGGPMHGYAIMRDIEDRSEGQLLLQAGALYRILKRLLASGLIAERPCAGAAEDGGRRRCYALTPQGRDAMHAEVDRMARLVRAARLAEAGKRPRLA